MEVPPRIKVSVIGKACGMSPRAVRGMLKRAGVLMLDGRRAFAPRTSLRERFPDAFEDVYTFYLREPEPSGRRLP
jgi:hypothetical protein